MTNETKALPDDWTECASHCCGCGLKFDSSTAVAIWHRMRWCSCASGLHPEGFADNGLAPAQHATDPSIPVSVIRAWLLDRAEQYPNYSKYRCVFDELLKRLDEGEPIKAYMHGELDDLLKPDPRLEWCDELNELNQEWAGGDITDGKRAIEFMRRRCAVIGTTLGDEG